ncbi:hypothetical protein SNEBB_001881 [Seison nebaliae]|nr:hypothetical protein SNEBB_001881 [Seison nebaliae]
MESGTGSLLYWGISPNISLIEKEELDKKFDWNILSVGTGDARHIIRTISDVFLIQDQNYKLNFYMFEENVTNYVRILLFFHIIYDDDLDLREKSEIFLELYGNLYILPQSKQYLTKAAIRIIKEMDSGKKLLFGIFDLSKLKFRERDLIIAVLDMWRSSKNEIEQIDKYWNERVRRHLKLRYDSRAGVFDWDYSMKLAALDAEIMGSKNYLNWREKGIAFPIRDEYDLHTSLNRSLMNYTKGKDKIGNDLIFLNYNGDIELSPYIAYGIENDDDKWKKKGNNMYFYSSLEISKDKIEKLFYQILNRCRRENDGNRKIVEIDREENSSSFIINFLPNDLFGKSVNRIPNLKFDIIYFGASLSHLTGNRELINSWSIDDTFIYLETVKYLFQLKDEANEKYMGKMEENLKFSNFQKLMNVSYPKERERIESTIISNKNRINHHYLFGGEKKMKKEF